MSTAVWLKEWGLIHGEADLRGANLFKADLSGANLRRADLRGLIYETLILELQT
jgi:uncharacterized protein YjbI with pentapeptide repeats